MKVPDTHALAWQIAAGRTVIATSIMAAPVASARALGTDTATAQRVSWLTRMTAIRDGAIGVGGVLAARRGAAAPWLLAGAASDLVDAVVIGKALRDGRIKGVVATVTVPLAALTAVAGAATAIRLRGK
jgi:hypothetical protein